MANPKGNPQNLRTATPETRAKAMEAIKVKKQARMQREALLYEIVSDDDMKQIFSAQVENAKAGDLDSAKFMTEQVYGKLPTALVTQNEDGETMPIVLYVGDKPMQPKPVE